MDWDLRAEFSPGHFHLIAAGPPYTEYSVAKMVGVRNLEWADQLVCRAKEIIEHFNPPVWWIENPPTGLLKTGNCWIIVRSLVWIIVSFWIGAIKSQHGCGCPPRCLNLPTWYVIHTLVPKYWMVRVADGSIVSIWVGSR